MTLKKKKRNQGGERFHWVMEKGEQKAVRIWVDRDESPESPGVLLKPDSVPFLWGEGGGRGQQMNLK